MAPPKPEAGKKSGERPMPTLTTEAEVSALDATSSVPHTAAPPTVIKRYPRRRKIFFLSLGGASGHERKRTPLYNDLDEFATIEHAFCDCVAIPYLRDNDPDVILITDAALMKRKDKALLAMIVSYVRRGGIAIFCLDFFSSLPSHGFGDMWKEAFKLPWSTGSYHWNYFQFNPTCVPPANVGAIPQIPEIHAKVLHMNNARSEERIVVPVPGAKMPIDAWPPEEDDSSEAAVVGAKYGTGYVAYIGDVHVEPESLKIIAWLCRGGRP